ncbi:hypothetical protein [Oceanidesulfovibrio marinus]|uniref:Uncharacterized protein n=1 Tax=Oceanidesulfovibrio marinus TaxID=370038 RepID=A0A6P1ZB87_9BACT|nr:hypothetical protein [Oceanidesulfovibrio marinus]TVM31193.1 hypothetical protein DQK91_18965 [Oceanidesulfovibrio marinus]
MTTYRTIWGQDIDEADASLYKAKVAVRLGDYKKNGQPYLVTVDFLFADQKGQDWGQVPKPRQPEPAVNSSVMHSRLFEAVKSLIESRHPLTVEGIYRPTELDVPFGVGREYNCISSNGVIAPAFGNW